MKKDESEEKLAEGTLISHLLELRNRLIRAMIAWVIVLMPCFYYANTLFEMVSNPIKANLPPGSHLIATGAPHPAATALRLDRFSTGRVLDEKGVGAQPNLH